jgi:hypothetical protein
MDLRYSAHSLEGGPGLNKKSHLSKSNSSSRLPAVCHLTFSGSKAPCLVGIASSEYPRRAQRRRGEATKQQARSRQSTGTSLVVTSLFQRWYWQAPTGLDRWTSCSPLVRTSNRRIRDFRRLSTYRVYMKRPTANCQRAQPKHGHQGLALCKMKRHRALWGYHGSHMP